MVAIQENIALAPLTTLGVGGAARYFAAAHTVADATEALVWARERQLPVFILGGGSNLVVSDAGFAGLVLHVAIDGLTVRDDAGRRVYSVGAGVEWDAFVSRVVDENCGGVECLSGIPGSVGATPVQNVGAYGQEVSDSIQHVDAIALDTLEPVIFPHDACGFHYRHSRFNSADAGRYLITRVEFVLTPGAAPRLDYADLQRHFADLLASGGQPSLAEVRQAVLTIRGRKGMVIDENDPDSRSAGSFFRNPVVSVAHYQRIAAACPEPVPHFAAPHGELKLPAAWLIEHSGLHRGFAIGEAAISGKHTLALVNRGHATAADMLHLRDHIQRRVRDRFSVELEPEPVLLGF
jgi:UDP-N-acetylmuramate dehydrogenase